MLDRAPVGLNEKVMILNPATPRDAEALGHADAAASAGARLSSYYKPACGSDYLVVVFSQARVPVGKFGLQRLFDKTRHACLCINTPDETWYLGQEFELDEAIEAAIRRASPKRLIYYGASKGAYGALAAGLRRADGEIYAFGPELELGLPGSQSAAAGIARNTFAPDLIEMLGSAAKPVHLVFGAFDPMDAAGAYTLSKLQDPSPVMQVHLIRSSHASHDHLYSLNIIRKVISAFDRDLQAECRKRDLVAGDDPTLLGAFAGAGQRFAAGYLPDPDALSDLPGAKANPGVMLLVAQIRAASGNPRRAAEELAQLQAEIDADPVLCSLPKRWRKAIFSQRIDALLAAGDGVGANAVRANALSRFPEDPRFSAMSAG